MQYYCFCFGLVSDSRLAEAAEDDARFQLEEGNVFKVTYFGC